MAIDIKYEEGDNWEFVFIKSADKLVMAVF